MRNRREFSKSDTLQMQSNQSNKAIVGGFSLQTHATQTANKFSFARRQAEPVNSATFTTKSIKDLITKSDVPRHLTVRKATLKEPTSALPEDFVEKPLIG